MLRTVELPTPLPRGVDLLVTGLNDSEEEISRLVDWVASLDPEDTPAFLPLFPEL